MLRLELKDVNETVLFIEPTNDVKIRKGEAPSKDGPQYELDIETDHSICYASYYLEEERDDAYEYVLNKIDEYLFPQVELKEV